MFTAFTTAGLVIFCFVTILFLISIPLKRNDIADVAWGTGILLVGIVGYWFDEVPADVGNSGLGLLLLSLYALWGLRLTYRIGRKNFSSPGEDPRYKRWREEWGKWFYLRSYFQVYLLQGFLMLVVGSPLLIASSMLNVNETFVYIGLGLWVIGFLFEAVGDWQLDRFIARKKNGETDKSIMNEGLWRYSRHPNYFGEVTMWWAIWLMVATLPGGWLAIISPLTITFLILKVSGIPLLEEKFADNPEFAEYKKRTSAFFPLPTKR